MPLLQETAELLSDDDVVKGIVEEIIYKDHMFALLPFTGITGKALVYDREEGESPSEWLLPNETVPEGGVTFKEVTAKLRILIGDVDVDKFLDSTMSDRYSQKGLQLAAKLKSIKAQFQRCVAYGDQDANPRMFDGIGKLVSPEYTISAGANGNSVSFSLLDELRDAVILGADGYVMRTGTWRAIKQLLRATGGNTSDMLMQGNLGFPIPAFDGVPVILNDFLPTTEVAGTNQATCSIYAARFNEADGLHGIYGGGPAGFVVEDIGTLLDKDATRTRVKWYASMCLKSTRSLAAIKGITNI